MLNQAFDSAQARGAGEDPESSSGGHRGIASAFDLEREHPAEWIHLSARDFVTPMRGKRRVVHALDARMRGEKRRHLERVLGMCADAARQSAQSAERQPAIESGGATTAGIRG